MAYKSLSHFISALESEGELIRIREFVSPDLEITEITDRIVKNNGKALLFENNGTEFPLLINAFGSEKRICLALGVNQLNDIGEEVGKLIHDILGPKETFLEKLKVIPTLTSIASWLPKAISGKGSCQEVVMDKPDLSKLPVLTCWPADGGPFITLPAVHTRDPETGARNVGMYRMQVFSETLTAMHWHLHKGSALHYQKYRELKQRMPVTVTLGGDPVYTYAATAPLPDNLDEYVLAGFLRKKKVEMVRCLTNELEIPEDVDFVIEGYIDPEEELILEGPFGDHTGFYSLADYYPRFHVTCITHRKNAVYPSTIVGIPPMEDGWIGKATERIFLTPIRMTTVPEIRDMNMPVEGVFHNIVLISIDKRFPGQGLKVMNSLWGAGQMMFNKVLVVTGKDVSLGNYHEVARIVTRNADPLADIQYIKGPVDILDHSSRSFAFGSKMGIDATEKLPDEGYPETAASEEPFSDRIQILDAFPEITAVNDSLIPEGISLIIISVKKSRRNHIREISNEIVAKQWIRNIRFVIYIDSEVNSKNLSDVTWICANNIDPMRDCYHVQKEDRSFYKGLFIDGTRKTNEFDQFQRDWPNIILMDEEIIKKIDKNWRTYQLGEFIPSPSVYYKSLVMNAGAVADKNK